MSPREEESTAVDYTQRDAVETMLSSQTPCEDDDHCMRPSDLAELRKLDGNDVCVDCGKLNPEWASISLGIFMCLECSGQHRALGTHVSKVRSVNMDSWSPEQLGLMKCGGNKQCVKFLKQHGLRRHHTVTERYDCAVAMWYQQILKARREGTEEPKELPNYKPTRRGLLRKDSIRGLGSSSSHRASLSGRSLSASAHGSLTTPAPKNFVTATKSFSTPRTKTQSFQDKGGRIESGLQERGKLLEVAVMDSARNLFRRMSFGVSTSSSSGIDVAAAEEAVEDANEEEETKTAATSQESFGKDGQGENSESSSEGEFGQESISMVDGGKEEEH